MRISDWSSDVCSSDLSLTAISQRAVPLKKRGGSIVTLTYYGAERVMPHYNVMGVAKAALESSVRYLAADLGSQNVRVNAISAGPIKQLDASGRSEARRLGKECVRKCRSRWWQ